MTGVEQLTVWLFGIFCAAISVCSAVKSWSAAKVDAARVHADACVQAHQVVADAQHGPVFPPAEWTTRDGEL